MRRVCVISTKEDMRETEELCESLGYEIVFAVLQRRTKPQRSSFLGKGKLESVSHSISRCPVDAVVVNGEMEPLQHYNLETSLGITCMDRLGLVLEIFAMNVHDKQAKLQVEKATLLYNLPLIKEWIHREKSGERPGFMGGGEYSTRGYEYFIRSRLAKIEDELRNMEEESARRSRARRDRGFHLVGLCGYTNAGKSSLMRLLTDEEVLVEDRVFSTLSTTTRRLAESRKDILVSDTIGFMSDLPPYMIQSFRSTLDQIFTADLVLLVVDASEERDQMMEKLEASLRILRPHLYPEQIVAVFNKTDISRAGVEECVAILSSLHDIHNHISVSARSGENIGMLKDSIRQRFRYEVPMHLRLPQSSDTERLVNWLYENTDVGDVARDESVRISLLCRRSDQDRISTEAERLGGAAVSYSSSV